MWDWRPKLLPGLDERSWRLAGEEAAFIVADDEKQEVNDLQNASVDLSSLSALARACAAAPAVHKSVGAAFDHQCLKVAEDVLQGQGCVSCRSTAAGSDESDAGSVVMDLRSSEPYPPEDSAAESEGADAGSSGSGPANWEDYISESSDDPKNARAFIAAARLRTGEGHPQDETGNGGGHGAEDTASTPLVHAHPRHGRAPPGVFKPQGVFNSRARWQSGCADPWYGPHGLPAGTQQWHNMWANPCYGPVAPALPQPVHMFGWASYHR